jgi:rare lipoprotein A
LPCAVATATMEVRPFWGKCKGSMRPIFCIFGLALAWLITSSVQAHSRGFAWFFAHSRPHGTCSGQHVVATLYTSGRRTASGQTFDPGGYTAAHRTLPFGSRVTVTNPQTGSSVTVVINDRGPFTRGVTLDLSRGAARAIGMHGTQWVCML